MRDCVLTALSLSLLVLGLVAVGTMTTANQNNPWTWKKDRCPSPATATADSKQSPYASAGAVLTQYQLDVKDATLSARSSVVLPRNVQYAWPSPDYRALYVAGAPEQTIVTSVSKGSLLSISTSIPARSRPLALRCFCRSGQCTSRPTTRDATCSPHTITRRRGRRCGRSTRMDRSARKCRSPAYSMVAFTRTRSLSTLSIAWRF